MGDPRRVRPALLPAPATLAAALLLAWALPAAAQAPADAKAAAAAAVEAAEAEKAAAVVAYPPERVPEEADRTLRRLDRLDPSDDALQTVARIRKEYDDAREVIEARIRHAEESLEDDAALSSVRDAQSQVAALFEPIREREQRLDALGEEVAASLLELDALATSWLATRDFARAQSAGEPVMRRIRVTREAIEKTRGQVMEHRDALLALRDRLLDARTRAEASHAALARALQRRTQRLLSSDDAPLWSGDFWRALRDEWQAKGAEPIRQSFATARQYAAGQARPLAVQAALFALLAAAMLRSRQRSRAAVREGRLVRVSPVFERPWSSALLLAFLLSPFLYAFAPVLFEELIVILGVIPAVRIVRAFARGPLHDATYLLAAIFLLDRVRHVLAPLHMLWRLAFLVQVAATIALLVWFVRVTAPERLAARGEDDASNRWAGRGARVALGAFVVAWLAGGAGWSGLSTVVATGTSAAAYAGVLFFAGARVLRDLLVYVLRSRLAAPSRVVQSHAEEIRERLGRVIDAVAVAAWAAVVLEGFHLWTPLLEVGQDVLDAGISVGTISLDVGHVLAFGLTLWISFLLARFVAFVLDRELLPRLELARGVPYALTSLARYSILFLGFFFALAAAGFDIDRIAFLAGGLGVGIGFGLQNVVNNFVSGLILLFERPVQVGDSVQLPAQNLFGRIRVIGIRASVIQTWDGAEVIVPNGDLISGVVTNWTLSDRRRRIDIPVEVARGSEPQRVIELLTGVAAAHENVVEDPAPVCFFNGHGPSSLQFDLRFWVRDFDVGLSTRSQVAIAVEEALRREGIEVPIPRLDVQTRPRPD